MSYRIEPTGSNDVPCECCGNASRTVWGKVYKDREPLAVYYVQWTHGRLDHGANFDFIIGQWGEGTVAKERQAVSLAYRLMPTGPAFMVVDAADRNTAKSSLVGTSLTREQVLGSSISEQVFAIADVVLLQDNRVAEILGK